ncbi:hypothetical protein V1512DRAFT_257764 [Lipomyces arxii]|uniref:uncharacterized protein n=1 Tax=Lipomyces arxii TaxID=56418 RepID=UPI0034CDB8DC
MSKFSSFSAQLSRPDRFVNRQIDQDEYSTDFSPESFTKRLDSYPSAFATDSPLLPPTPAVPHRPLDANKGYPLPTECFPEIDWVAEYAAGSNYSTILVPPEPVAAREPARPVVQATVGEPKPPSVSNSLVQTDVDGDDSMFWYKSTTRFASPQDDWDYERLRQRIRAYTTPSATKADELVVDVNETVRQTTVRRLQALLVQLTAPPVENEIVSEKQPAHGNILAGDDVDVVRLREVIETLSRPALKLFEMD